MTAARESHLSAQLEFFAEDEEVTIVPHFTLSTHESKLRCVEVSSREHGHAAELQNSRHALWRSCCEPCARVQSDMAYQTIHTLQGDYGPFKANFPVTVPLWLAIYLYQRKQCRIQPPDWLKVDHLQGR